LTAIGVVGRGPNGHRPFGFGFGGPVDDRVRVEPVGDRLGSRRHRCVAHAL
jgi:hypothetical protein